MRSASLIDVNVKSHTEAIHSANFYLHGSGERNRPQRKTKVAPYCKHCIVEGESHVLVISDSKQQRN